MHRLTIQRFPNKSENFANMASAKISLVVVSPHDVLLKSFDKAAKSLQHLPCNQLDHLFKPWPDQFELNLSLSTSPEIYLQILELIRPGKLSSVKKFITAEPLSVLVQVDEL